MSRASKSPAPHSSMVRPLIDRVREHVATAAAALAPAKRSKRGRLRAARSSLREDVQEIRALRRVFRDIGRTQRAARRQTGQAPFPAVREAAYAFQDAPSFSALVTVAASLDEVGLLAW
jgi:ABC-type transporter Mla subunit MlaD